MTLGECKRRILEMVFSYSIAGTQIPASYNNQADYEGMIPGLINQAEIDIATTAKRIYEVVPVSDLEQVEINGKIRYKLPADCWIPLASGLLLDAPGRRPMRYGSVRMLGGKYIELGARAPVEYLSFEYWRYPERVSDETSDDVELDNSPDVHECIVFYVAAHLLAYDDAYRYTAFMNEYEKQKARLREPIWLEVEPIHNLYWEG